MHRLYKTPKKERQSIWVAFLFLYFFQKIAFSTKGKLYFVRLIDVDKMLNAFTMHSFFTTMLSKNAVTMPFGTGAFLIYTQRNNLIHLIIHQIQSL